jgi:PP-loop superfamily ATP-utilizing enzyme
MNNGLTEDRNRLASRIETGIRIEPETLRTIHTTEKLVTELIGIQVVRCEPT